MICNDQNIKTVGVKLVMKGADKYRKRIRRVRKEVQKFNNCIQLANQNVERLEKSMKKFGKMNVDAELLAQMIVQDNGKEDPMVTSKTAQTKSECRDNLGRSETAGRTIAALAEFVERAAGHNDQRRTGREMELLPDVARVLVEAIRFLP